MNLRHTSICWVPLPPNLDWPHQSASFSGVTPWVLLQPNQAVIISCGAPDSFEVYEAPTDWGKTRKPTKPTKKPPPLPTFFFFFENSTQTESGIPRKSLNKIYVFCLVSSWVFYGLLAMKSTTTTTTSTSSSTVSKNRL